MLKFLQVNDSFRIFSDYEFMAKMQCKTFGKQYCWVKVVSGENMLCIGLDDDHFGVVLGCVWAQDFEWKCKDARCFQALCRAALTLARQYTSSKNEHDLFRKHGFAILKHTIYLNNPEEVPHCMPRFICYGQ